MTRSKRNCCGAMASGDDDALDSLETECGRAVGIHVKRLISKANKLLYVHTELKKKIDQLSTKVSKC